MAPTLFEKIIAGEIPCKKVWESATVFAFHDIAPMAPVHVLIVPKKPLLNVAGAGDDDGTLLGELLMAARDIARELGVAADGYRLVINNGADAGQSVDHLHIHLLAGRPLGWPPG